MPHFIASCGRAFRLLDDMINAMNIWIEVKTLVWNSFRNIHDGNISTVQQMTITGILNDTSRIQVPELISFQS